MLKLALSMHGIAEKFDHAYFYHAWCQPPLQSRCQGLNGNGEGAKASTKGKLGPHELLLHVPQL